MKIKAVKFRTNGFYTQPFVFGGEEGVEKFEKMCGIAAPCRIISLIQEMK